MQVVFLGTTGYHPSEHRHTLAVFLPQVGVLLDAGTGVFRLGRFLLNTSQLHIFLSHAHLDHVVGLTYLLGLVHRHPLEQIRLYGLPGTLQAVEEHLFARPLFPVRPPIEMCPLESQEIPLPQQGRLKWFELLQHPGGSIGFRLQWSQGSLAYVTDTVADPAASYVKHLRGVDVLIHECYFPDREAQLAWRTGHSHTSAVAQVAQAAAAKRLLLVHMDPSSEQDDPIGLDQARAIFPRTELARDLMQIRLWEC